MTDAVKGRIEALQSADTANKLPIPIDLVTVSASGLDPEISRQAAQYQASRVAKARKMSIDHVNQLIAANTQDRQWRIFGEPHVNVLKGGLMLMNIGPWNQKKCHHLAVSGQTAVKIPNSSSSAVYKENLIPFS